MQGHYDQGDWQQGGAWGGGGGGGSFMSTRGAATSTNSIQLPRNRWGQPAAPRQDPFPPASEEPRTARYASPHAAGYNDDPGMHGASNFEAELGVGIAMTGGYSSYEEEQYIARLRAQSSEPQTHYVAQPTRPSPQPIMLSPELEELTQKLASSPFSSSDLYYHLAAQPSILRGEEEPRAQIERVLDQVALLRTRREIEMQQAAAFQHERALQHAERYGSAQRSSEPPFSPPNQFRRAVSPPPAQSGRQQSPAETMIKSPTATKSAILPSTEDRSSSASIWAVKSGGPPPESPGWKAREPTPPRPMTLSEQHDAPRDDSQPDNFSEFIDEAVACPSGWSDSGDGPEAASPQQTFEPSDRQPGPVQADAPSLDTTSPMAATPTSVRAQSPARHTDVEPSAADDGHLTPLAVPTHLEQSTTVPEANGKELEELAAIHEESAKIVAQCNRQLEAHAEPTSAPAEGAADLAGTTAPAAHVEEATDARTSPTPASPQQHQTQQQQQQQKRPSIHAMSREELIERLIELEEQNRKLSDEVSQLKRETAERGQQLAEWSKKTATAVSDLKRRLHAAEQH
ncbi:uncharacterized protein PFL1_06685 [Pseudozyma flocculosa PF-1]|uniref:Uncharacterized protein n=2 Tax=Pseudozyma flocculosa TaxID=84751 RepID=A0A5C3FAL5_9BASI|nr:uncharacterized protein PFL1_06685 [Pseudozyma flocculosa PF-1]EPQ25818.1 hypothetical protein PFL1_06685 [Pseudozyma flocculosa PF-1]SPO40481.1 uncharacterized protein PSFLO_05963 [Pseudozyma flocculosa]